MTQIRTFASPVNGVGKTVTLLNTAIALARMGQRVHCVDTDPGHGLFAAGGLPVPDGQTPVLVASTRIPGLSFFAPAHRQMPADLSKHPDVPKPDWVLVDTAVRLPATWMLPENSRMVACTDASGEVLELMAPWLEDLATLRRKHPAFSLDRILFTRMNWTRLPDIDHLRTWRRELGEELWHTQIPQDRSLAFSPGSLCLAAPDSRLGTACTLLALEWLNSLPSGNPRFQHVDALV